MNHGKSMIFMAAIWILSAIAFGQTLTVVSPNGGERWNTGDTVNITWTSSGVSGDLRIEDFEAELLGRAPVEEKPKCTCPDCGALHNKKGGE